ncbi:HEPN domain-containing protein [soil metagenome]
MSERPDPNLAEARRWLAQADEELATAGRLASDTETPPRIACFLAHLAAEKAMKAWLISLGIPFRRVHDLAEPLALMPTDAAGEIDVADLQMLNPWTILGRYPDDVATATTEQAEACVEAAGRVLDAASAAIGNKASDGQRG